MRASCDAALLRPSVRCYCAQALPQLRKPFFIRPDTHSCALVDVLKRAEGSKDVEQQPWTRRMWLPPAPYTMHDRSYLSASNSCRYTLPDTAECMSHTSRWHRLSPQVPWWHKRRQSRLPRCRLPKPSAAGRPVLLRVWLRTRPLEVPFAVSHQQSSITVLLSRTILDDGGRNASLDEVLGEAIQTFEASSTRCSLSSRVQHLPLLPSLDFALLSPSHPCSSPVGPRPECPTRRPGLADATWSDFDHDFPSRARPRGLC